MRWGPIWLGLSAILACGPGEPVDVTGVVRDGRTGTALADALVQASGGAETRADAEGRFTLRVPSGSDRVVRAAAAGRCPGETRVEVSAATDEVTVHLFPRLELEEAYLAVGFGERLSIEVETRCDDQENLSWAQVAGPELDAEGLSIEDGGRRIVLRTPPLEEVVQLDPRLSVVSLSRAERAEYRFSMHATLGGREEERIVRVTAATPTAGVYQVPTGVDMYLNGGERASHAWTLVSKPEGSEAELSGADTRTPKLRPDAFGQYLIRYEPLSLDINVQAGAYDDVPRDCGREGCHRAEDEGWATTKHATTFRRGLEGALGPDFDESCWSCHVTGVDFGVDNGGFHAVARRIGWTQAAPHIGAWEEAPRQVRRFGSVWCSSCHGPGRILPPQFHWEYGAKFQAGVCAQCHDAVGDPDAATDSWAVREWRLAPMASFVGGAADPGPAARDGCAQCHSAQGFVSWLDHGPVPRAPAADTVEAIACAACHDPHDGSRPRALRVYDVALVSGRETSGLGTGAICATCHSAGAPTDDAPSTAPHAPQADVLLGRGSLLLRPARSGGVHALLADSCVACHMARPAADDTLLGRAGGHTFSVRDLGSTSQRSTSQRSILAAATCSACHGTAVPPQAIGGIRDWDGDGRSDNVGEEFDRAMAGVRTALRDRIAAVRVRDTCPGVTLGVDFAERGAELVLVDSGGALLGDCNRDGAISGREAVVGVGQLSRDVRRIVWDLALLEKDGSRGRHNPELAFEVFAAVRSELE